MSKKAKKAKNQMPKELFVLKNEYGMTAEADLSDLFSDGGELVGRYELIEKGKIRHTTSLEIE